MGLRRDSRPHSSVVSSIGKHRLPSWSLDSCRRRLRSSSQMSRRTDRGTVECGDCLLETRSRSGSYSIVARNCVGTTSGSVGVSPNGALFCFTRTIGHCATVAVASQEGTARRPGGGRADTGYHGTGAVSRREMAGSGSVAPQSTRTVAGRRNTLANTDARPLGTRL